MDAKDRHALLADVGNGSSLSEAITERGLDMTEVADELATDQGFALAMLVLQVERGHRTLKRLAADAYNAAENAEEAASMAGSCWSELSTITPAILDIASRR